MKAKHDAGGDTEEGNDNTSLHGPGGAGETPALHISSDGNDKEGKYHIGPDGRRGAGYTSFSAFPSPSEALKRHRHTDPFPSLLLIVGGNMEGNYHIGFKVQA